MSIVLLLFFTIMSSYAQSKHLGILGGGGEPEGEKTIFDEQLQELQKYLGSSTPWKTQIAFNGGHSETEAIIKNGFKPNEITAPTFSGDAFEKMISSYEEKIKSGEIKSGDQLLLYIASHGALKGPDEKTHRIALSGKAAGDLTNLSDIPNVSLDRLKRLSELANEHNIKLGIIDTSCHSGSTLTLANDKTCVIGASGPDHMSWSDYGPKFIKNIGAGKSLEDVFVTTFDQLQQSSFPTISSPAGKDIQALIYPLITPYLYEWHERKDLDKLQKFLVKEAEENKCSETEEQYKSLLDVINHLETTIENQPNLNGLRLALKKYYDLQTQLRDELKKSDLSWLSKIEEICSDAYKTVNSDGTWFQETSCLKWTNKEILGAPYELTYKHLEEQLKTQTSEKDIAFTKASIESLKKAQKKAEELLGKDSQLKSIDAYFKNYENLEKTTMDYAQDISKEIQKIYPTLYNKKASEIAGPNPCRDFVF